MNIGGAILFFFSALGAFNGLILSLYFLFFSKNKHISNYFLAIMLFAISTRIGKSVFFYFNPDLEFIYLQMGLSVLFFAGPSLFLYIKSVYLKPAKIESNFWWHYLISILIVFIVGGIYPFSENVLLWRSYFINGIYFHWLCYILASAPFIYKMIRKTKEITLKSIEFWLLSIFLGNLIICIAYLTACYTSYIVGALSFSFILYLMIILLLFKNKREDVLKSSPKKYINKRIPDPEANSILDQLNHLIESEKIFLNPSLRITDVAERLKLSSHKLSQLLNDNFGKNFSSYINDFRISQAKNMLLKNDQFSIEAIGQESGFKSNSSFYTAFKKSVGLTPAQYKNQNKSNTDL